uniref:Uncharacterized protein n=1 Tax=Anguilla anguilla TaxID=7936 RepID=A0A0E9TJD1_ANGAN
MQSIYVGEELTEHNVMYGNAMCVCFLSVAVLTARIRNYQEHLQQHPKVRTEVKTTASLSFTLSPVQKKISSCSC